MGLWELEEVLLWGLNCAGLNLKYVCGALSDRQLISLKKLMIKNKMAVFVLFLRCGSSMVMVPQGTVLRSLTHTLDTR